MRPVFFSDIDGVIRARDTTRNTSGNAHDFDPALHYDMDQFTVFNDRGHPWEFHYSTEMIADLRDLIESGKIEFIWNTNWRQWANVRLTPLFGFPAETKFLNLPQVRGDHSQTYKGYGILDFFSSESQRHFIWADDIATRPFVPGGELHQEFSSITVPHHIIVTEERFGITRAQMAAIREFAESV
jgi:hypothetical protein